MVIFLNFYIHFYYKNMFLNKFNENIKHKRYNPATWVAGHTACCPEHRRQPFLIEKV